MEKERSGFSSDIFFLDICELKNKFFETNEAKTLI